MNRKQKICLCLGIAILAAMAIYPPWVKTVGPYAVREKAPGPYSFIMEPPPSATFIDLYRLSVQWITVAVITGGLIFTFKDKDARTKLDLKRGFERIVALLCVLAAMGWSVCGVVLCFSESEYEREDCWIAFSYGLISVAALLAAYGIVFWIIAPIMRWIAKGFEYESKEPQGD